MLSPEDQFFNELYSHYGFRRKGHILNHLLMSKPITNSNRETDNTWYSLPSPGDGSCLFHSIIMCLLSDEARPDIAISLRRAIANSLTITEYSELQGGILAIMNIQEVLQNNMTLSSFSYIPPYMKEESFKKEVDRIISNN